MATKSTLWGRSEQGAIFVHVGLAILMLTAMATFVLDYGVFWLSRGQAQNAADAGALSGAIARAYDDFANPPAAGGVADTSARLAGEANKVWSAVPTVRISYVCPPGVAGACVRADVYRNGEFGSTPLPTVFGPLLGIATQGVKATATAVVANGNATNCMRPFAVADRWAELAGDPLIFDHWEKQGGVGVELMPHDNYVPPTNVDPGTGYRVPADIGVEQVLKGGNNPASDVDPITAGWFLPLRLPDGEGGFSSGADDFRTAIATCIGNPVAIGDYLPTENGVMNGPTGQGVGDLIALDPAATFNMVTKQVENSCAPGCAASSPRIVPITVFDIEDFQQRRVNNDWGVCPGGGRCVKVVNILGFFVDRMNGNDVVGYLISLPGEFVIGSPSVGNGSSFLRIIQLVR